MPTRSITDDIIIEDPEAIERLLDILEEGERNHNEQTDMLSLRHEDKDLQFLYEM
jgi:hypothetical protein